MDVWEQDRSDKRVFSHGQESWLLAAETARRCPSFARDDEDETVCEEERSCYNCRYRRWTADSFECRRP
jgi:hypothetical protein